MKLPREELAEALTQLKDAPRFWVYVRTLSAAKEAVFEKLLDADAADVEALRGEVRAYHNMLKALKSNGVDHVQASSGNASGQTG